MRFFVMEDHELLAEARNWKDNHLEGQPLGDLIGELTKRLESQINTNETLKESGAASRYAVDSLEDQVRQITDLLSSHGIDVSRLAARRR